MIHKQQVKKNYMGLCAHCLGGLYVEYVTDRSLAKRPKFIHEGLKKLQRYDICPCSLTSEINCLNHLFI